ncbi:MAG: GNAT family N-acetyltransferase [Gemmatimonadetes bacterium]|nr:GNAT family N-acetyltransferase [Gemmatimonadota bacterium]MBT8461921.1 GNAT family N-acetyltransferase [Gemmatimonadota bacterium]NNK63992.1 GNAT family N-acetyltransferase [Gemmatimonadota bacterium]
MRTSGDAGPIVFRHLTEVDPADIIDLMNDPSVRRHLPLMRRPFDAEICAGFVAAKEGMWASHGYGPWALTQGDEFIGWGGLQPEGPDADLGLILKPTAWGVGRGLLERFLAFGFDQAELDSVIALLPPTRRGAALKRVGFVTDGAAEIGGERFLRYRLFRSEWSGGAVGDVDAGRR